MFFLQPCMKQRPTLCTETTQGNDDNSCDNSYSESCNPSVDPSENYTFADRTPATLTTKRLASILCRKAPSQGTPSAALMKYILENKNNSDDIVQFFASIATIKLFPFRERVLANFKVFNVISKMETDLLSNATTDFTNHYSDDRSGPSPFSETETPESPDYYQHSSQTQVPQPLQLTFHTPFTHSCNNQQTTESLLIFINQFKWHWTKLL